MILFYLSFFNFATLYFFFYILALAKTFSTILIEVIRMRILSLFLNLEKKSFQFTTTEYDINCQLFIYGLYYVEVIPSSSRLLVFFHKMMLNLSSVFTASVEICDFYPSFCWCGLSHWLIFEFWTILEFKKYIPLERIHVKRANHILIDGKYIME